MMLRNPYTQVELEYPIDFSLIRRTFHIEHETDFCSYNVPWEVTLLTTGDMVYIPGAGNRSYNIYIVTKYYRAKQVSYPHGIYTIPLSYFTTGRRFES